MKGQPSSSTAGHESLLHLVIIPQVPSSSFPWTDGREILHIELELVNVFFSILTLPHSLTHLYLPFTPQQSYSQERAFKVIETQLHIGNVEWQWRLPSMVSKAVGKVEMWKMSVESVVYARKNKYVYECSLQFP